jgi:hypothetical protein
MKTYCLSCNLEGHMDDNKFSAIVLDFMPFDGIKEFYPLLYNGALFFQEMNSSKIKWWHGWLKGFNLVRGIAEGHNVDLLDCGDCRWINVETDKFPADVWLPHQITFYSVSVDIGGEELLLI